MHYFKHVIFNALFVTVVTFCPSMVGGKPLHEAAPQGHPRCLHVAQGLVANGGAMPLRRAEQLDFSGHHVASLTCPIASQQHPSPINAKDLQTFLWWNPPLKLSHMYDYTG